MTPIWDDDFKAAGYKPYRNSLHALGFFYQGSWQKRVTDAQGTRYFINVDLWEFGGRKSCALNLRFRETGDTYVDITRQIATIAEGEDFAFRAWNFCGANH